MDPVRKQLIEARRNRILDAAKGHIRPVRAPLTVRAVQSMFVGLLVLRILGDEPLQSGWGDLPEVLATLILDGLRPREGE